MKTLLHIIRQRGAARLSRWLKAWEQTRKKGRKPFLRKFMIIWATWLIVGTSLLDFYSGKFYMEYLWVKIIFYPLGLFIVGLMEWESNEGRYRKFNGANSARLSRVQSNNSLGGK